MEKLGVELPLLITQIVNFTIMVVVLTKILYKPILKGLAARRKKIEEGLKLTEKMQLEEERLAKKQEEMLSDTREEARLILENAKKDGKKLKDELVAEGKQEVVEIKVKMERELRVKYEELSNQVVAHTIEIAAGLTRRVLPKILNEEAQHKLIEKELTRLEGKHGKS